jgi:hypothetical protein
MSDSDRSTAPGRVFPVIRPAFYTDALSASDAPGARLLALTSRPLSLKQRLLGWDLRPEDALARLFQFHRSAFDAESGRAFARSAFFWRLVHHTLSASWSDDALWQAARDAISTPLSATAVRDAVLEEVVVDSHWAFHAEMQGAEASKAEDLQRGWQHLRFIWDLTARTQALSPQRQLALETATRREIQRLFQVEQWKPALEIAELLVSRSPRTEHQDLLGLAVYYAGNAKLQANQASPSHSANAKALGRTAQQLEQLRVRFDRNALIYDLLARVYRQRAVSLANSGSVSEALVEIKKAPLYDPALDVDELDKTLHGLMVDLQARAAELQAMVRGRPNARLNVQGQQIVQEGKRGFGPAEAFMQSDAPNQIRDGFVVAQGNSLLESAGMDGSALSRDQLRAVYELFFSIRNRAPERGEAFDTAWATALSTQPSLQTVDLTHVRGFLQHRLYSKEPPPNAGVADTEWPQPVEPIPTQRDPAIADREPLTTWIFSPQSLLLKGVFAAALIVFLVALGLFVRDRYHRQVRDTAFAELREARVAGDADRLITAAEQFLANSIFADDPRDAEVADAYSAGLVQWALAHPTPSDEEQQHLTRYRTLVLHRSKK